MEKIAVISDIHGNLEALKSTLKEIKSRGISRIFCLGDIIHKGAHFHECISLIQENCEIVLKGNCDDYFTRNHNLKEKDEVERKRIEYNQSILNDEEKAYLKSLNICYEFYMSGRLIRLFHASPKSVYDNVGIFANIDKKYQLFLPSDLTNSDKIADIAIYGHLHTQFVDKLYNRSLINCGSIGNSIDCIRNDKKDASPFNVTNCQYLILEGNYQDRKYNLFSYQFVEVPYDIDKELENKTDNLEYDSYSEELHFGKYRDIEKIYRNFEKDGVDVSKI